MFAIDLSFFCTITTITSIVTFSSLLYFKTFYKIESLNKNIQTDYSIKKMINNETQTDCINSNNNSEGYYNIVDITYYNTEESLENLMILAKNELLIELNTSRYKWIFMEEDSTPSIYD